MPVIKQISVVYAAGTYIFVNFDEALSEDGKVKEQIGLEELNAYIDRFQQQEIPKGNYINFAKGTYEMNNKLNDAVVITSNSGGVTPPPGSATKNFILLNRVTEGDNISITDFYADVPPEVISSPLIPGLNYQTVLPLTQGQALRGDLGLTPRTVNATIEVTAVGLGTVTNVAVHVLGESHFRFVVPVNNGVTQIPFNYDVSYGGTLCIVVTSGDSGDIPPPARSGMLTIEVNKANYQLNSIDAVDMPSTGLIFPVVGPIVENGTWSDNTASTLDVNITASIPPFGNAYASLWVNGVNVDTQVLTNGVQTITFVNVPNGIPNSQPVRIAIYGD
jgi:hypothetical protein